MLDAIKHITDDNFFFQKDSAQVHCVCITQSNCIQTTQSNCCGTVDFLSPVSYPATAPSKTH